MGQAVATDTKGNVYVTGGFNTLEFIFDGDTLYPTGTNKHPGFILSLDSSGNEMCGEALESGGGYSISIDSSDNIYVGGAYDKDSFVVGNEILPLTGGENSFLAKLSCGTITSMHNIVGKYVSLQLRPNPFTTQSTVQYSIPDGSKNSSLVICDMLGRERSRYPLNNSTDEITISTNNLSSGVFLYSLVVDGRVLVTKKMVVEE